MTIGVIAKIPVQDGKGPEFEAFFQLTKSRTEPNVYKVLELYADQDALTHHGGTDYFKAAGPKFGAVLAGRPEIEYLDGVG
jgi:quinol monooxygenase YgiN